jgi:vacuolar protein sorting-associated protein 72
VLHLLAPLFFLFESRRQPSSATINTHYSTTHSPNCSPIAEEEDVVDDDFDAPAPAAGEDDEEYENDTGANADRNLQREERSKLKKQPGYVDPRKKGANAAAAGSDAGAAKKPRVARTSAAAATTTTTDVSGAAAGGSEGIASHRTQRRSVAKAQELRAQERAEQDAALTARARARGMTKEELLARQRERSQTVHRALTQKEQLEQAKLTEIHNKNSLEELLKIEEAQKRITVRKRGVIGPAIFTRDRAGAAAVSFKHCVPFGYAIELAAAAAAAATGVSANSSRVVMLDGDGGDDAAFRPPVRRRRLHAPAPLSCAVTGAPARYRDPVTGLPFASAAVLPQLRRRAQTGELTREAYERAHFADVALDAATYGADPAAAAAAAAAGAAMGDDDEVRPATKTPGRGRKAAAK